MIVYYFLEGVIAIIVIVIIIIALTIFSEWLNSKIRCWYNKIYPYDQDKKKEKDITK